MKIYIANVGVNTAHALRSPLFDDGKFEFVPIPEGRPRPRGADLPVYGELRAYNSARPLLSYFPEPLRARFDSQVVHYDPNLNNPGDRWGAAWSYGDIPFSSVRASALRNARPEDLILFLANLVPYRHGRFVPRDASFHFIAYLEIGQVLVRDVSMNQLRDVVSRQLHPMERYRHNVHVLQAIALPTIYGREEFMLFEGTPRSHRFVHAIPLPPSLVRTALRDRNGKILQEARYPSMTACLGVYTRTVRPWFSTSAARDRDRFGEVIRHVGRFEREAAGALASMWAS